MEAQTHEGKNKLPKIHEDERRSYGHRCGQGDLLRLSSLAGDLRFSAFICGYCVFSCLVQRSIEVRTPHAQHRAGSAAAFFFGGFGSLVGPSAVDFVAARGDTQIAAPEISVGREPAAIPPMSGHGLAPTAGPVPGPAGRVVGAAPTV